MYYYAVCFCCRWITVNLNVQYILYKNVTMLEVSLQNPSTYLSPPTDDHSGHANLLKDITHQNTNHNPCTSIHTVTLVYVFTVLWNCLSNIDIRHEECSSEVATALWSAGTYISAHPKTGVWHQMSSETGKRWSIYISFSTSIVAFFSVGVCWLGVRYVQVGKWRSILVDWASGSADWCLMTMVALEAAV